MFDIDDRTQTVKQRPLPSQGSAQIPQRLFFQTVAGSFLYLLSHFKVVNTSMVTVDWISKGVPQKQSVAIADQLLEPILLHFQACHIGWVTSQKCFYMEEACKRN